MTFPVPDFDTEGNPQHWISMRIGATRLLIRGSPYQRTSVRLVKAKQTANERDDPTRSDATPP